MGSDICSSLEHRSHSGNPAGNLSSSDSNYPFWKCHRLLENPVEAVQVIKRMRGGCQSKLLLGDDGNLWVVKFQNNPEHVRVLANEMIGTRIASALSFSVPPCTLVNVSSRLLGICPELVIRSVGDSRTECSGGLQFGSRFVSGLMPGQVVDTLPGLLFCGISNLNEIPGMLAFDKWTGNCDRRQVVYRRTAIQKRYQAVFIDQGHCFNAGKWTFPDAVLNGAIASDLAYLSVTGWDAFEPWLTQIEQFPMEELWSIIHSVPHEWYEADVFKLERLMDTLLKRRSRVRELIEQFRNSDRQPFPLWGTRSSLRC